MLRVLTAALAMAWSFTAVAHAAEWQPGRYMEGTNRQNCKTLAAGDDLAKHSVIAAYMEIAKGDILVCDYPFQRRPLKKGEKPADKYAQRGWVVLADPPAETVAKWIQSACEKSAPTNSSECTTRLKQYIAGQSGAQFPVLGFVAEGPNDALCKQYGEDVKLNGLISFQDGVAVQRVASPAETREGIYCATDGWGAHIQQIVATTHKITQAYFVGRLAGLHSSCASGFLTDEVKKAAKTEGVAEFLMAVRHNHLAALRTGRDAMMEFQAARFGRGELKFGKNDAGFRKKC